MEKPDLLLLELSPTADVLWSQMTLNCGLIPISADGKIDPPFPGSTKPNPHLLPLKSKDSAAESSLNEAQNKIQKESPIKSECAPFPRHGLIV